MYIPTRVVFCLLGVWRHLHFFPFHFFFFLFSLSFAHCSFHSHALGVFDTTARHRSRRARKEGITMHMSASARHRQLHTNRRINKHGRSVYRDMSVSAGSMQGEGHWRDPVDPFDGYGSAGLCARHARAGDVIRLWEHCEARLSSRKPCQQIFSHTRV